MQAVREAKDYSADERRQFQEAFRPIAIAYRRHRRTTNAWFFAAMGCVLFGIFSGGILKRPDSRWITISFFGFLTVWFVMLILRPRLVCPGCSRDMEVRFGDHCPECGSKSLIPPRGINPAHCTTCGMSRNLGRGPRRCIIRNCTHCGLRLDEKGLGF